MVRPDSNRIKVNVMALQHQLEESAIGVAIPAAYTVIKDISIARQNVFSEPLVEGGEAVLISSHALKINTESFASKSARDAGYERIGYHSYTIPYPYDQKSDALSYAYEWLRANISMFSNSLNV